MMPNERERLGASFAVGDVKRWNASVENSILSSMPLRGHEYQDAVSLEMARQVAARLHLSDEPLNMARENLARWMIRNAGSPGLIRGYQEWLAILDQPKDVIISILLAETDEGQRHRQNSPFPGVLSPQEVWAIKERLKHETG
ncbi:MAG: hypothetical protein ACO1QB_08940 [Verrucomicrobiales bacterium]